MQVASSSSAAPWAPYATSDNVPKPRQVAYRPTAPFSTSDDAPAPTPTSISRRHTFTSSVRAPFASHDDAPQAGVAHPDTPPSRAESAVGLAGSRPSTTQSNLPPFDNDNQPALLPPRPRIRMAPRAPNTCPYDTAPEDKPQSRTAPIGTYAPVICINFAYFGCMCMCPRFMIAHFHNGKSVKWSNSPNVKAG